MDYQQSTTSANNFEQCLKCGICTVYCPVTAVNPDYPGPKQAGPDGERYRLKEPEFFDEALKYCLNCKRCEVACPSGVRIGDIIQAARMKYSKKKPGLRETILANTDFMGSVATLFAPIVNTTLKLKPVKSVMSSTIGIARHRTMPKYSSEKFTTWFNRNRKADQDKYSRHVTYFHGCYAQYNYPQLGKDFVTVMNAMGIGVHLIDKERCCGVAKIANGLVGQARRDARSNTEAMRAAIAGRDEEIVGASSTCVFTMRDEYPHVLGVGNDDIRDRINLVMRYIHTLVDNGKATLVWKKDFKLNAAYHTACHMARLGWSIHTLSILHSIPGLTLETLPINCCGIAGTYGFKKENYETSQAIGSKLFDTIAKVSPQVVITECETCKWQIEMSTGIPVMNPISVLAQALDIDATAEANARH